ncbi:MAG: 2-C-methyl-D-erythritol 2,4-cyclodiphosphate synthase [Bacteroidales bacterium]|nr:2-C-methyl-D-erythritol 2,4-cyclodiphosphate synthase [Bacteroidales bacterium]
MRIGIGYDVHQLVENRKLILGGIEIPYSKGLLGHSDADVLVHAICDALLGALALGDIGQYFPDSSEEYKGIDSMILLKKVHQMIANKNYIIGNIDATLILQSPKISPYILRMRSSISEILQLEIDQISIKATTSEGLGYEGREEGVSAQAVCLLLKKESS